MSLGGEAFGSNFGHSSADICRPRCGPSFLDLGEQPGLHRRGGLPSRRIIMRETARLEDYRAQLGDAAATTVVEVHERQARAWHRILQERDHWCCRKSMLAAQMQKRTGQAVAAVSVIV